MDALTLLARADEAGLAILIAGGRLKVRGSRQHEALVQELARHKAEVIAHLARGPVEFKALTQPLPWRASLAEWPDEWREKWGRLANALEDRGHDWREAERLAFEEVSAFKAKREEASER